MSYSVKILAFFVVYAEMKEYPMRLVVSGFIITPSPYHACTRENTSYLQPCRGFLTKNRFPTIFSRVSLISLKWILFILLVG